MNISEGSASGAMSDPELPVWVRWLVGVNPLALVGVAAPVALAAGVLVPDLGPIILVGLLGAVGGLVSFLRPGVGLFLFTLMLYTRASEVLTASVGIPSIAPLFLIWLLTAIVLHVGLDGVLSVRPAGWQALAIYGLVLLASVLVAVDPAAAMLRVTGFVREIVYISLIVLFLRKASDLRIVVRALIVAGVIPACLSIFQTLSGSTYTFLGFGQYSAAIVVPGEITEVARPSGMVGDPNFYALALLPLIPLALHRARWERTLLARQLSLLAALIITVATILTFSRGGYITIAAIVGCLVVAGFVRIRSLVIVGILFALLLVVLPSEHSERFASLIDIPKSLVTQEPPERGAARDTSVSGRVSEIMAGVWMFADHPILGVGTNNYPEHYQEYARPMGVERRTARSPHSLYVEIAAETGIVGLIAFGGLVTTLFVSLRKVWQSARPASEMDDLAKSVAISLLALLLASTFLHFAYPRFLMVFVGLTMGISSVANQVAVRQTGARFARLRMEAPRLPSSYYRRWVAWGGASGICITMILSAVALSVSIDPSRLPFSAGETRAAIGPELALAAAPRSTVTPVAGVEPSPDGEADPAGPATPAEVPLTELQQHAELLASAVSSAEAADGCLYVVETQHNICDEFQEFYVAQQGPDIFGAPISEQYLVGGLLVQYFERARLEWHADAEDGVILLARLGALARSEETGQEIDPPVLPEDDQIGCIYESVTGHNTCGRFAAHWLSFGGIPIFGYPITEQFEHDGVRVQYFERARFELRPDSGGEFDLAVAPLGSAEVERLLAGPDDDGAAGDD